MSKMPDFEGLAMFAKVAEERSFAAAAKVMGVSVATVSRGVSRLEERLGARLLNRTSRQMALTEFGLSIAESASRLYREAEQTEGIARELSSVPRGLVRLAIPMTFGVRWVAPILPEFLSAYPDVCIDLHLSDAAVDLIGEGFDAAIRIAIMPDSSLVARRLCRVSRYLVASPSYFEKYGHPETPQDLAGRNCLGYAYRAQSDVWRLVNASGEEVSITPSGSLRVTNVEALMPAVLAGIAIAELPEFVASEYLQDGRLQAILPEWSMQEGGLYFVTPSARARPAKVDVLADFLVKRLSDPAWRWERAT
ncbi:DNA-binding transcriptional regulator, LysR family [Pseudomonas helmanticensis]|uniref:DNA-binding transcriptional regulator, LysR family n=1 Tax=Pseudomonas helmanticensis TaxID=1471381 RepID=A0ACD2UDB9_9PSED|nr:LysR family transcriptional regulator [Pseudomonas helmanticensis]SMQ30408.1 DNA-binding transcriptional regulator, LysR family [Pseudomonas helmanticensis]